MKSRYHGVGGKEERAEPLHGLGLEVSGAVTDVHVEAAGRIHSHTVFRLDQIDDEADLVVSVGYIPTGRTP